MKWFEFLGEWPLLLGFVLVGWSHLHNVVGICANYPWIIGGEMEVVYIKSRDNS